METKDKHIAKTLALVLCRHGMWMGDITDMLAKIPIEDQLDYAIIKCGKVIRVPATDENANLNVIGVFPSKTDGRYLELKETDMVVMTRKSESEVPAIEDFESFVKILEPLNKAITKAGGIPLIGEYHTIISFGEIRNPYPFRVVEITPQGMDHKFSCEKKELKAKIRKFIKP